MEDIVNCLEMPQLSGAWLHMKYMHGLKLPIYYLYLDPYTPVHTCIL